jgi:hypothetical protein
MTDLGLIVLVRRQQGGDEFVHRGITVYHLWKGKVVLFRKARKQYRRGFTRTGTEILIIIFFFTSAELGTESVEALAQFLFLPV